MSGKEYPSFWNACWVWFKVAMYSFGGPANQIAVMHKIVVEEKKWVGENRFLHALNYCMLLPGPEAHQLVIYLGWLLHRYKGGLAAGILFLLPGIITILILSILYAKYHSVSYVQTLFFGIKAAVIAIVFDALIHIGKKALKSRAHLIIAFLAFVGIFFFKVPFPIIIACAALLGFILAKYVKGFFEITVKDEKKEKDLVSNNSYISSYSLKSTLSVIFLWVSILFFPTILSLIIFGKNNILTVEGYFFTKTALISFGGAYAVLAYISQQSVQYYHWLSAGEMLDGLGMAETMPGPLIKIVQFIGFMAAFRNPGDMSPLVAGLIGSAMTAWVTFVPSFLWIFSGAPYIEKLRKMKNLHASMTAITAAVVGVILNLSIWFSMHALFHTVTEKQYSILRLYVPSWDTFDLGTFIIMAFALILVFIFRAGLFTVLGSSILLGFLIKWLFPL